MTRYLVGPRPEAGNRLLACGHIETGIVEGMSFADARKKYQAAIDAARGEVGSR